MPPSHSHCFNDQLLEALQNAEDEESEEISRLQEELATLKHQLEDARRDETISSTSVSREMSPLTPVPER